jgi:hypothetical protein
MSDPWEDFAGEDVPDEPTFDDLPVGAWVVGQTCTEEQGGAAPTVRTNEKKDGSGVFRRFNIGVTAVGGDRMLDATRHANRMVFFQSGLDPWENDKGPVSGRMAGFMNAVFSCGVGNDMKDAKARSKARWENTTKVLREFSETKPTLPNPNGGEDPVTFEAYQKDWARYLTGLTCAYLRKKSTTVLFKTRQNKNKKTGEVYGVEAGMLEEATDANRQTRKVSLFEAGTEF